MPTTKTPALTLTERRFKAENAGHGPIAAAVVHMLVDKRHRESSADPFYLALVLSTFLVYLYTRQWEWVLVAFAIYYVLESALFFAARAFNSHVGSYIHKYYSRANELVADPIVFALALLTTSYVLDSSALTTAAVPSGTLRALFVGLATLPSAFSRAYFISLAILILVIWIVYFTQAGTPNALEQALVASAGSVFVYLMFLRPINHHYLFNALFALLYIGLFSAILTGISLNL